MRNYVAPLPLVAYLHECFIYRPIVGDLRWRERPLHHFPSAKYQQIFNNQFAGKIAGYIQLNGYRSVELGGTPYRAHRIIWCMLTGEDPGMVDVDHKNRKRDDNRKSNLRLATYSQTNQNSTIRKDNTSGHVGVYPRRGKWVVQVSSVHYGIYLTFAEAVAVRDAVARKEFGAFFPS